MRRIGATVFLLWIFVLSSQDPAFPQYLQKKEKLAEDLTCRYGTAFEVRPRLYACIPLVFEFENEGADRTLRVNIEADGTWTGIFAAPGGKTSRGFLYLPCTGHFYSSEVVFRDQETGAELKRAGLQGASASRGSRELFILTVAAGNAPQIANDFCWTTDVRFDTVPPERLPDSWTGLTAVDLLVVPHGTWTDRDMKIDPVVDWVAMGGVCLIIDAPDETRETIIRTLEEKGLMVRAQERAGFQGQEAPPLNIGAGQIRFLNNALLLKSDYFGENPSQARNYAAGQGSPRRPELVQLEGPPFLPVLFFLIVFSVLVGPVGWWYAVGRKGRPLYYFVLAPLLSVCVVVIVVAVDFLDQGITPRAACIGAELIDQQTRRRITLSQFALYFPFSIGQSLEGDFNELPHFLSVQDNSRMGYSLRGLSAAPGRQGMTYAGTALPARKTSWYAREKIAPERRRLEIWKEDGRILAENHLGIPLRNLVVCCEGEYAIYPRLDEGEKAEAETVSQGEAVTAYDDLHPEKQERAVFYPLQCALADRWLEAFHDGQNTYAARRDGGFEDLLWIEEADMDESRVLVLGIY